MTSEPLLALRAVVRGRVQEVGFRAFVEGHAVNLGLEGFVRNLKDGVTVEVVAEGSRESLDALRAVLWQGRPMSNVESIDETWGAASGLCRGFNQRQTL